MEDVSRFCCQNKDCLDHGQRGKGNLMVRDRYGKDREIMILQCKTCRKKFSSRKGTPYSGSKLSNNKVDEVLAHIQEGCGTRKTSRLTKVSTNVVTRLCRKAGEHAAILHEELVPFSP